MRKQPETQTVEIGLKMYYPQKEYRKSFDWHGEIPIRGMDPHYTGKHIYLPIKSWGKYQFVWRYEGTWISIYVRAEAK